jgi:hypothetical protein
VNRIGSRIGSSRYTVLQVKTGEVSVVSMTELLASFRDTSYEGLLALLRSTVLVDEQRERVLGELRTRDRAMHNQWVQVCGGEFK